MKKIKSILLYSYPNNLFESHSLLILRMFTGIMMIYKHGWSKIISGKERWNGLGTALTDFIGLDSMATFFGFMAAFSESIGMIMVVIGMFTRPAAFLLLFTMLIASINHIVDGKFPELAMIYFVIMLVISISGPGKFSLDYKCFSNND